MVLSDTAPAPAWLDSLAEPVLLFETGGRLRHANPSAQAALGVSPGMDWPRVAAQLAEPLRDWLARTWLDPMALPPGEVLAGPELPGAAAPLLNRLGSRLWLLSLPLQRPALGATPSPVDRSAAVPVPAVPATGLATLALADGPLRQLYSMLWSAPFPATLQDESFRLLDVNPAYAQLCGWPRERLLGRDPLAWQPDEDHQPTVIERERLLLDTRHPEVPALREHGLLDARGRLLRVRAMRYRALTDDGRCLVLTLMQDTTAEQEARERAERHSREIDQWFELSPLGMALLDSHGAVLRANSAFARLLGAPLRHLREAPEAVRALLHFDGRTLEPPRAEGAAWVSSDGALTRPGGGTRWVRALMHRPDGQQPGGHLLCTLEDRTAQEERDLARLQLGALADTAAVLTQGVRREQVEPTSLPDYDRLQDARRRGDRAEARYAIVHPSLGRRWLYSRVQPGVLGSGRTSTSVVTLDVTEEQAAHERSERLRGDLSTILESSPAGIASLQGLHLVQCNRRFEHMLGLADGSGPGSDLRALLAGRVRGLPVSADRALPLPLGATPPSAPEAAVADDLAHALASDEAYEAELELPVGGGDSRWLALSVRRTGTAGDRPQGIAVLSDITRLKAQQLELARLAREREQLAEVLGQQADRTRAVLDSVLVGIVTVDARGDVTWLNRSARRMFGGNLGDFLGRPLRGVAPDDPDHPFTRSVEVLGQLQDGESLMFECRVRGRDGRTFWVVGNAVATFDASAARELTVAIMDIEQRRQAESRVAQARASLQRIIEAAPMAIILFDVPSLAVRQINRVAARIMGMPPDAAVGRSPVQLFPPAQASRLEADLRAALAAPEGVTERELRFPRRGVEQVWDLRYLPLSPAADAADAADGPTEPRVDQVLLVASDVTAQRAAQRAELEAAIAQREMLVQEVHHRIKNNLQGVAGLLRQIGQRRPEVQPVIAEVVGQVQAIAQVYGLQVGGVGLLRVQAVVEAIAQSVGRTFGREIEFAARGDWSPDWTLPEAESIPIALILNELLTNAIKHSPAGEPVGCRVDSDTAGVRIEIDNAGVLAPGFRIDHRPAAVSGLGLVRALLPRRHAGLDIEARGARVVARVSLTPPVVRRPAAPSPSGAASSSVAPPPSAPAPFQPLPDVQPRPTA